jgi:hypothetical protein
MTFTFKLERADGAPAGRPRLRAPSRSERRMPAIR